MPRLSHVEFIQQNRLQVSRVGIFSPKKKLCTYVWVRVVGWAKFYACWNCICKIGGFSRDGIQSCPKIPHRNSCVWESSILSYLSHFQRECVRENALCCVFVQISIRVQVASSRFFWKSFNFCHVSRFRLDSARRERSNVRLIATRLGGLVRAIGAETAKHRSSDGGGGSGGRFCG